MWQSSRCPEIWHQMALCRLVPGDNRDRSGRITTHYLLIILVWSADPAVCVSGWHREPVAPGSTKILPTSHTPSGDGGRDQPGYGRKERGRGGKEELVGKAANLIEGRYAFVEYNTAPNVHEVTAMTSD